MDYLGVVLGTILAVSFIVFVYNPEEFGSQIGEVVRGYQITQEAGK